MTAAVQSDPPAAAAAAETTSKTDPAVGDAKQVAEPAPETTTTTTTTPPATEPTESGSEARAEGKPDGASPPNGNATTLDEKKTEHAPKPSASTVDATSGDVKPAEQPSDLPLNATTATSTKSPRPSTTTRSARDGSIEIDNSKPADFDGEIATNNDLPTPETLKKIENYVVLDKHGKSHTFKSLYSGRNVARRVLIIFVRHFFCGNCQEFLRSLSESITPDALLGLPMSTFIAVIGCGNPGLIEMYLQETGCPFPVYTDPTRRLFDSLGMSRTLAMGTRPAYMRKSMLKSAAESVFQGLKQVKKGLATKSGDHRQVGGEFLFEPEELVSPVSTPFAERQIEEALQNSERKDTGKEGIDGQGGDEGYETEEKRVTWCHRMRSTRDHAEIPELMEVLGLTGSGKPIEDSKRWSKALETRKGTGLSMASQMSKSSEQQEHA